MRLRLAPLLALLGCAGSAPVTPLQPIPHAAVAATPEVSPALVPPVARVEHTVIRQQGDERVDDYAWLRKRKDPEVERYLRAEDAYADQVMASASAQRDALYRELVSHVQETDVSAPWFRGGYWYYERLEQGKQYPIRCRKHGSLNAAEQVILNQNAMAAGKPFLSISEWEVSDDGRWLAYLVDDVGFRQYVLHVRDLRTGQDGPEAIPRVRSIAWAADDRTLFYSTEDPTTKRSDRVFRHRRGESGPDPVVLEEKDERFNLYVSRTRSGEHLLATATSHTSTEIRFLPARNPATAWRLIAPRVADQEYSIDHRGSRFYIVVNDRGPNFRLVSAPISSPGRAHWKEELPERPAVVLEGVDAFVDHLVLHERQGGLRRLRILDFGRGGKPREVTFPEPTYAIFEDRNEDFRSRSFRFAYQSLVTPKSIIDVDLRSGAQTVRKRLEIPGGFDPANYRSEYLRARAADGTEIPISVVYRLPLQPGGSRPLWITGYGAYGYPNEPSFESNRLTMLDRGFVIAIAHIRGGGEFGKRWHDAGRMGSKPNTFTDFVAATEYLQAQGYGRKERTVASGGSAGGLLMGAVLNIRPDLYRVVLSYVPFVDLMNTMSDPSLPLTVPEYEEWGNPARPDEYRVMRSYSPYDNVAARAYPIMLVRTSYNDSQVMYWEPAKWVARLRATKTDSNPLLFKVKMEPAGHGGASGRYDRLRDVAFDQSFVLTELGLAGS